MGYFPDTIAAALQGTTVRVARLVELDFLDGTGRYWEGGLGPLATSDGKLWQGTGDLGSIGEIESAIGTTAPQVTLALSGVDASIIRQFVQAEDKVKGRGVTVFIQFFDADWETLDAPYAVFVGLMDVMSLKTGTSTWSVSLTCEGLFTRRAVPPFGYLSAVSQQGLFPGDLGLNEMGAMRLAEPFWPVF